MMLVLLLAEHLPTSHGYWNGKKANGSGACASDCFADLRRRRRRHHEPIDRLSEYVVECLAIAHQQVSGSRSSNGDDNGSVWAFLVSQYVVARVRCQSASQLAKLPRASQDNKPSERDVEIMNAVRGAR